MDKQAEVWRERIARQQASGQGVVAWCAEQGVNRKTMWAWQRRLARAPGKPRRRRGAEARRHWGGLMREQARSGMSVAAFCRERQLCAPQFFQWKKRLAEAGPPARGRFIPVEITARAEPRMALEVVLGNGRVLRVAPGFDREHLAALIAALEGGR